MDVETVALFSRTPAKGELASSGQPGLGPQVLEQGAKLGLKQMGIGPLIFLAFAQAVPTAKELHSPGMTVIPIHQHPAQTPPPPPRHSVISLQRGLSVLHTPTTIPSPCCHLLWS